MKKRRTKTPLRLLLIAFTFGILIVQSVTAQGLKDSINTFTPDSCICYTDDMDKAAQECWENYEERQNELKACEISQGRLVEENKSIVQENVELKEENEKQTKKTKRNRTIAIIEGTVITGSAVIIMINNAKPK